MSGLELLEKYPLAKKIVKDWFMTTMLESFKDESVPEDFKQFMLEQGVEDDKVGKLIDVNPRMLFDVFDENDVIIYSIIFSTPEGIKFSGAIHTGNGEIKPNPIGKQYDTRREAEKFSIEAAFEILEEKLREERMTIIAQNGNTGKHYEEILEE
jgi:hypothetical protein